MPPARKAFTTASLVSCSGARNTYSAACRRTTSQALRSSLSRSWELITTAEGARVAARPLIWSCCRAISGDTTSVTPGNSTPGTW